MINLRNLSRVLSPDQETDLKVQQEDAFYVISNTREFAIIMAQSILQRNLVKSVAANIRWRFAKGKGFPLLKDPGLIARREMNREKLPKQIPKEKNLGSQHSRRRL